MPNYPSTAEPLPKPKQYAATHEHWAGQAVNFKFGVMDEDYVQAKGLWDVLGRTEGEQEALVENVSMHLKDADVSVRRRTYGMFARVDSDLGSRIEAATEHAIKEDETNGA